MTISYHYLAGHYRNDDGTLEAGDLDIIRSGTRFAAPGCGPIVARPYTEAPGTESIQITSRDGAWRFVAARAECDRVGLAVE